MASLWFIRSGFCQVSCFDSFTHCQQDIKQGLVERARTSKAPVPLADTGADERSPR